MHKRTWTGLATTVAAVGLAVTAGALPAAAEGGPTANFTVTLLPDLGAFDGDASSSVPGQAAITSYTWDFGDGVVETYAGPSGGRVYAHGGVYTVTLTVTDAAGLTASTSHQVPAFPKLKTTALLGSNLRYVTAESGGAQPLIANRATVGGTWERLDLVDAGADGSVGLRAQANGKYVTVDPATSRLIANGSIPERFQRVDGPNGTFSLRSTSTGKYVSGNNGTSSLTADRTAIGEWERFYQPTSEYGLNKNILSKGHGYVSAEAAGTRSLIANRSQAGLWETFDYIDAGNGWMALFSHADDRFVTAESGGNQPLIANRTAVGAWERFLVIKNRDGFQSLQAGANTKYVTADLGIGGTVIANRAAIGDWEEFMGLVG